MQTSLLEKNTKAKRFQAAVVGLHGRFPEAIDVKEFWENQLHGRDAIRFIPAERWDWEALFGIPAEEEEKTYSNCAGFMPFVDRFDSRFFGILPREAATMDPQQRLFLQTAWAALEDAGYAPSSLSGRKVGVFVGVGYADYPVLMRQDRAAFDIYRATGIALTCIANRVSFTLNLCGPSEVIDTACSGSLIATHRAIQSMAAGECDMAIVGGVNLLLGPELFIAFAKAGMLSQTGRCRTFDTKADGYVRGEGVAAMVLCPLETAEQNRDYIYGVIQGSAENHGGRAHSFTAPNVRAQFDVIQDAWRKAGLSIRQASLIETHGTGTPLGDPIEINALKKAWEADEVQQEAVDKAARPMIVLGALKSHVGHLEAAAGIAGLIKCLMAMQHRRVPGNLHYDSLNPHISLEGTPFTVSSDIIPLTSSKLLAGVSSFGFGGVNAHVVVQSYDANSQDAENKEPDDGLPRPYLIPFSAKDDSGLLGRIRQIIDFLEVSGGAATVSVDEKAAMLALLCTALEISTPSPEAKPLTLAALGLTVSQWLGVLKKLALETERAIDVADFRDIVTVQEAAERLAGLGRSETSVQTGEQEALCCRIAAPAERIRAVTMEQLVHALMHGRDAMEQRIAFIAYGKQDLLAHLHRYIATGEETDPSWVRGSIKSKKSVPEHPVALTSWPEISDLRIWAEYWVHAKAAQIKWQALCPGVAVPSKFPLPAYPFRLERIWYKAGRSDEFKPAVTKAPKAESISLGLIEAWTMCWQSSRLTMPTSVMGLAGMLDHLDAIENGRSIALEDVVFGRPVDLQDEQLIVRIAGKMDVMPVQCLSSGAQPVVLVQANMIAKRSSAITERGNTDGSLTQIDGASAYYEELLGVGLNPATSFRCVESIKVAPNSLVLGVSLSRAKTGDGFFWATLLSTILAGVCYVHRKEQGVGALLLPWRIQSLVFDAKAAAAIRTITIDTVPTDRSLSICAIGANNAPALVLQGLRLRSAAVAGSANSASTRQGS